ncbi:response regulator VieB [Vibrio astriarenae]|nr:response regulator VieB [Vibrio sp. C7]
MVKEFLQPYLFNHERPVLIIDDSSVYRSAAKGILQKLGFEARNVHQAQNGREAKVLCAEHNYAIIFYDYNLGAGLSGYHLMEELVSEKAIASDCTNIVVSAEGAVNVVRSFMELSPDGYLLKPISHDILKQKLPTIVKTKATLSEAYIALDQGRFEQVLEMTEEMIQEDESTLIAAQALKARAQIELNLLHDARNTLSVFSRSRIYPLATLCSSTSP